MNSMNLPSFLTLLAYLFAGFSFFALLLVFWPRGWWIWKGLDGLLHWALERVQKAILPHRKIDRQRWNSSFAGRVFILRLAAIGIVCIAIFPFGKCCPYTEKIRQFIVDQLRFNVTSETPYHYWEAAVFLWSAMFFILVQIYDGYHYADAVLRTCGKAYKRGLVSTLAFIAVIFLLYFLMVLHDSAQKRLIAELGLVALFCIQDVFFMKSYSNEYQAEKNAEKSDKKKMERLDKTSDNYMWFLLLLDMPGFFAFVIVWAYVFHCQHMNINQEWQAPFAAGAAALNLLLINVVYSALAVWQKYLDAEPSASPAAA
jgi:hypothetical protein